MAWEEQRVADDPQLASPRDPFDQNDIWHLLSQWYPAVAILAQARLELRSMISGFQEQLWKAFGFLMKIPWKS